jgi:hypothetical protein
MASIGVVPNLLYGKLYMMVAARSKSFKSFASTPPEKTGIGWSLRRASSRGYFRIFLQTGFVVTVVTADPMAIGL